MNPSPLGAWLLGIGALVATPSPAIGAAPARIRVSDDGHYFVYKGKPTVLFGAGVWTVIGQKQFDFRRINRAVREFGANANRATAWAFADADNQPWRRLENGKYDLGQWNEPYWRRLRDYVSDCDANGIVVILELFDEPYIEGTSPQRWQVNPLNPRNNVNKMGRLVTDDASCHRTRKWLGTFYDVENPKLMAFQDAFVRRVLDETRDMPNVIYELCNEYGGEAADQFPGHFRWVQHWIDLFAAYEREHGVDLLLTNMPFGDRYSQREYLNAEGIEVIDYFRQTWPVWDSRRRTLSAGRLRELVVGFWRGAGTARRKPVVSARTILNPSRGESSYEESRKEFWTTFVSGGHIGSYREIYKRGRLDLGQLAIIRHLRSFIDRVPFWRMQPVDDAASSGLAFVAQGEHYIVYLPAGGRLTLDLGGATGAFEAQWYDPRTGAWWEAGTVRGKGKPQFEAPDGSDWVLYARRQAGPGQKGDGQAAPRAAVTFKDISALAGIQGLHDFGGHAAAVADVNGDGWEDVYVTNCGMRKQQGRLRAQPNLLFLRTADGKAFQEVAEAAGVRGPTSGDDPFWHGAVFADLDNDGDFDLIEAKWGGEGITLSIHHNDGRGRFTDATARLGANPRGGRRLNGVEVGDFDNDGWLDLVCLGDEGRLLRNDKGTRLVDVTESAGLAFGAGFSAVFADVDNDGWLDLLVLNTRPGRYVLYRNTGTGTFEKLSRTGLEVADGGSHSARAAAFFDYDRDGRLDVFVARKRDLNLLMRNESENRNGWLRVKLTGVKGDAGAVGAKVWIFDAGHIGDAKHLRGYRQSINSRAYLVQNSPIVHFGLGSAQAVDVRVQFLGGKVVERRGVPARQLIHIDGSIR